VTKVPTARISAVPTLGADLARVLEKTALLSSILQQERQVLASRKVRQLFSAGELLFSEGKPYSGLPIIAKGKVRIFKTSVDGREQVLTMNVSG
jgi:CRP/FNR family transcriptional regulator, dissimilatory nitrate respiration regulator